MALRFILALVFALGVGDALAETVVLEAPGQPLPASYQEAPALAADVQAGKLPPVAERLPQVPLVEPLIEGRGLGHYGGDLDMLVGRAKDSRLLSVYGYARLVVWNTDFELEPDILQSVSIEDGRIFTLKLRAGHKWSDGHPFTSEDFRYWWEDVANNAELSPSGPPIQLLVEGELPTVTFPDETTVVHTWSKPNPFFLPALAGATPLYIYRPSHYMKQFHVKYADPAALQAAVDEAGKDGWAPLHNSKDNLYNMDNPALPTLEPWQIATEPPTERMIAKRNPYFHRIDESGQQLPYIDDFVMSVVSPSLIPTKTGAGETDLQSRGISFGDYTFLKEAEKRGTFKVLLWETVRGSELALYPNLNASDPDWRKLTRDARFRRALSLAIDREEINQVIYYGLGQTGNQSALESSPLYKEELRQAYAGFDLDEANRLLDEVGLTDRNGQGIRMIAPGKPLEIVVETAGETLEESDVLELIKDSWKQAGISLFSKPSERTVLRNRIFAGDTVMAMWFGTENAQLTADMSPEEYVPVRQQSYQWPMWGQFYETKGQDGQKVDMPEAERLLQLYDDWRTAATAEDRTKVWEEILQINADQVYTIGLVAGIPQPVVVSRKLHNVPEQAIYNWEPGAQFGMHRPTSFWMD
jgi:peptide/nickel transport system substrate-binding protein